MYKLLIADDEPVIRETIAELIDWKELDVQIVGLCKNGLDALDTIIDTAPDIVMTDIRMPGLNGIELIGKIHALDPRIQFIILSGYQEFAYARQAIQYGVCEYLLKPINEEQIISAVTNAKRDWHNIKTPAECLAEQLLQSRAKGRDAIQQILDHFFAPVQDREHFRALSISIIAGLCTQLETSGGEVFSRFAQELVALQTIPELHSMVGQQIFSLLFSPGKESFSVADTVKLYVNTHLSDPNLSLKYIAEHQLYMNVDYLGRRFTALAGERFSSYLNRTRVEQAKSLLRQWGTGSIHQVAEAVGYGNNPHYFSQIFKKYTGVTPSQFLENGM